MIFAKDYEFLTEIGIEPRNNGCFVNGVWKEIGSVISSLNPANNKLRGRSGLQGDPGSSRFFLCLEDDIFCIFWGIKFREKEMKHQGVCLCGLKKNYLLEGHMQ